MKQREDEEIDLIKECKSHGLEHRGVLGCMCTGSCSTGAASAASSVGAAVTLFSTVSSAAPSSPSPSCAWLPLRTTALGGDGDVTIESGLMTASSVVSVTGDAGTTSCFVSTPGSCEIPPRERTRAVGAETVCERSASFKTESLVKKSTRARSECGVLHV